MIDAEVVALLQFCDLESRSCSVGLAVKCTVQYHLSLTPSLKQIVRMQASAKAF